MFIDIHGYNIEKEIYQSPRSEIFSANREKDNLKVAIKMLNNEYPSLHEIARFQHEYQIQKNLKSQGVIQVYDLIKYGNKLCMIMEYIEDGDISKLIENKTKISLELFFEIAIQLSNTLSEIHQAHLIHKDIKPKNILWDSVNHKTKIIDFGIATELTNEKYKQNSELFKGSLIYMSPEQTGRMNRGIDYRTDFYSLGITLFELLTGELPFNENNDIMGWFYSHIAKNPKSIHEFRIDIPDEVVKIINKLMSKNAEDRYKSAFGLKSDLQFCQKKYKETKKITNFQIGKNDISDKFEIPQKLYGRKKEINALMKLFEEVSFGNFRLVLVEGYSGIGKSSLINEIYKPIVASRGYFIEGKFDQFQRNIPYSAISKAFGNLIKQLLMESSQDLKKWKEEILIALGSNGQVLIEIIPELEKIIGKQPKVLHLGSEENQNRFNRVFQEFLKVFCKKEHPLILFLDDLQWADSATLNLIKILSTNEGNKYLFLIGAYRDNEIKENIFLTQTIEDIIKKEINIPILTLKPLSLDYISQMISETVNRELSEVDLLSKLLIEKTNGNPFFASQFLKSIYNRGFFNFNVKKGKWEWNIEEIKKEDISNNVVELMIEKLKTLPKETKELLKLGACIGNSFNLKTLSIISEKNINYVAKNLWPAVIKGHLITENDSHSLLKEIEVNELDKNSNFPEPIDKFLHDRVQQAAYSMIDEDNKKITHLKIGRLLLKEMPKNEIENKYFEIVGHFNKSFDLIKDENEKLKLAELNYYSGNKAKEATAYSSAKDYFLMALDYLKKLDNNKYYKLNFNIKKHIMEIEFLLLNHKHGIELSHELINHCKTLEEKVEVKNILILYYGGSGEMDKAINIAISTLKMYNVIIPRYPSKRNLVIEFIKSKILLIGKDLDYLKNMPVYKEKTVKLIFSLLKELIAPTYLQAKTNLLPYMILRMFNLTLKYGNGPVASFAYSGYGLLWSKLNDFDKAYKFGKLAMDYNSKINCPSMEARVYFMSTSFSLYWKESLKNLIEPRKKGLIKLIETGEYFWASYMYLFGFWQEVVLSKSVNDLVKISGKERKFAKKAKQIEPYHVHTIHRNLFMNFMKTIEDTESFDYNANDEKKAKEYFKKNKTSTMGMFYYSVCKIINNFYYERYDEAVEIATNSELNAKVTADGTYTRVIYTFFTCLSILKKYGTIKNKHKYIYKKNKENIRKWVTVSQENFGFMWYVILAEEKAIKGDRAKAFDYYEKAIEIANNMESLMWESLANELMAKLMLKNNSERVAIPYMTEAIYLYYRWEAFNKVEFLEKKYSNIIGKLKEPIKTIDYFSGILQRSITSDRVVNRNSILEENSIDMESLQKASQALSKELVMENLILKLKNFLIENAGAQLGILILKKGNNFFIEAKCSLIKDKAIELESKLLEESEDLSIPVVRYTMRTKENVVLNNASQEGIFINEAYIKSKKIKSLLCIPLITKDEIIGILYLENNLITHAFSEKRVKILQMISSEIAIALDNAKLYRELEEYSRTLEEKVNERTKELNKTNKELKYKNMNIMSSIKYAKRIQNAVLPDVDKIRDSLKETFIIYKPKDIVSGDFYWFSQINNRVFFATVDCTGHGVPGAFLSMIGNTLLNKIVNENKVFKPALILESLHLEVRTALRQEKIKKKRRSLEQLDGMDICICQIDFKKNIIQFAGAKRSLYLVRKNGSKKELLEIKGDRKSIGGRQKEDRRVFTNHKIDIMSDDMIYMFSDGYIDQHNTENRRFGMTKFEKLLVKISDESPENQKNILVDELEKHMTNEQQRDDITVVGIRLNEN